VERFVTETTTLIKSVSAGPNQKHVAATALDRIRSVSSTLLTPGLSEDIDGICQSLGIRYSAVSVGFSKSVVCSMSENSTLIVSIRQLWIQFDIQWTPPTRSMVHLP
jgi:hypothetical protein